MKELFQVIYALIKIIIEKIKIINDTDQSVSDAIIYGGNFEVHHQNGRKTIPKNYATAKAWAKECGGSIIHTPSQTVYKKEIIGLCQNTFEIGVKNKEPLILALLVDEE